MHNCASSHARSVAPAFSHSDTLQNSRLRPWLPEFFMLFVFCFLAVFPPSTAGDYLPTMSSSYTDGVMSAVETEAVYEVLEAINGEVPWRILYPGNLCMEGPHGIICGVDEINVLHVLEINLGWVSEADNNPQCAKNASISPALGRFPYLRRLFFYKCFTQNDIVLPSFLWRLGASLEELVFLRNTKLVGSLPEGIANLVNMKRLILVGNGLQGSIPKQLGEMKELIQLVLSSNGFTGEIPETLGGLANVRIIDMSWNSFEASIPSSIFGRMQRLQKLDLSHNKLTGSIPASIGKSRALRLLDLSWNKFSGVLPDASLGQLTHLRVLQVGHNSFNGSDVPRAMWVNLGRLVGVGMAEAGLGGRIPEAIGQLRSLRYLDLRGNQLEGEIPGNLGQMPSIFQMDLSGNQLQGVLPFSLEFVLHMGRNLRVANNEGLCCSPQLLLYVGARLPVCDYNTLLPTRSDAKLKLSSPDAAIRSSHASDLCTGMAVYSLLLVGLVLCSLQGACVPF